MHSKLNHDYTFSWSARETNAPTLHRIILENAAVRAAAVSALAKFGAMVPSLRESMVTLLRRSVVCVCAYYLCTCAQIYIKHMSTPPKRWVISGMTGYLYTHTYIYLTGYKAQRETQNYSFRHIVTCVFVVFGSTLTPGNGFFFLLFLALCLRPDTVCVHQVYVYVRVCVCVCICIYICVYTSTHAPPCVCRCVHDADDEVRDRSTFYAAVLSSGNDALIKKLIVDVQPMNLSGVERSLVDYR
jgi:hypothetical protein